MIQGTITIAITSATLALLLFLCAASVTNAASATSATTTLPDQVFWDNNWPSDLKRVGDDNSRDNDDSSSLTEFPPFLDNPYVVSGSDNLNDIGNDPESVGLTNLYASYKEIEVKTWNGSWIGNVYLPEIVANGSFFQLTCGSQWGVKVHYNNGVIVNVGYKEKLVLMYVNGEGWIDETRFNAITTPAPTPSPTKESDNLNPPLLEGTVLFAQNQIIPSKNRVDGDTTQPHLTAKRKTLVMMKPRQLDEIGESIEMTVRDKEGAVLSAIAMNHPNQIPKQEGWVELGEGIDADNISFPSSLTDAHIVQWQSNLNTIGNDESAEGLLNLINQERKTEIEIKTQDGSWVKHIYLPNPEDVDLSDNMFSSNDGATVMVQITCNSGYNVNVHYPKMGESNGWRNRMLSRGQKLILMLVNGKVWLGEGDLDHNQYVFGHGFYSAILDREWILPGMTLSFSTDIAGEQRAGVLDDIEIGSVTELIITTIDAGFLTEPRDNFSFKDDPTLHQEYWETCPISRLIVAEYESIHLTEVMLPSGKLYTEASDTDGGWHSGDMRQYIGKILFSHGIDMANYGISSSLGSSESSHPFTAAFLTAHNTVGMYQNGRQVHGGSGGNGMVTLDSSVGNELSHEFGHNYGLGHYVDGFAGSVHRSANEIDSGWGWDSEKNVFVPNFASDDSGLDQCLNEQCQSPFLGKYRYGTDSMAGGSPQWKGANRYTLYTPNTNRIIQNFLEGKAVFDETSTTGFKKWDPYSRELKEFTNPHNGGKAPSKHRVAVTTIVGYYDPDQSRNLDSYVYPALHGAFGFVYGNDGNEIINGKEIDEIDGCILVVETTAAINNGGSYLYHLSDTIDSKGMNKFHVNVSTKDQPHRASVRCNGQLIAERALEGPSSSLSYTVTGLPFKDVEEDDSEDGVDDNVNSPTESPTKTPTANPTAKSSHTASPSSNLSSIPTKPECKDVTAKIKFMTKRKKKNWKCKKIKKKKKCHKKDIENGDKLWLLCPVYCRNQIPESEIQNLWCVHTN